MSVTFSTWLKKQRHREDLVGDLAGDFYQGNAVERCCPSGSVATIRDHLRSCHGLNSGHLIARAWEQAVVEFGGEETWAEEADG